MSSSAGLRNGDDLAGKVALVTGGARNIGRAICRELAAGGATVMVNANTSVNDAKETVALIEQAGGKAAFHIADITQEHQVARLVDATVKQFGHIDMLVSNAAIRIETPFEQITLDEWHKVLAVVLDGAFLGSRTCLPHLKAAGGGAIVLIGGMTGHKGAHERAHVITAKAGLAGLTKALAMDLAAHNITVNCVVPGTINTENSSMRRHAATQFKQKRMPPIGRRGEPWEIAAMVRMPCGPGARYVTGQAIHVNGGYSCH